MFQGTSALSLDAKGRLTIPTRLRADFLEADGSFVTFTRHPDGCLLVYQRAIWDKKRTQLAALPYESRKWQRFFLGSAQEVEIDASGRVLIPPELRGLAKLEKEVVLMGVGEHFELWDAATLKQSEDDQDFGQPPDSIAGFSL